MNRLFSTLFCVAIWAGRVLASPLMIDDVKLSAALAKGLGEMVDAHQSTDGATLAKASKNAPSCMEVKLPDHLPKSARYEELAKSVYIIGSVSKCGKCEKWHLINTATAWCLTSDGVLVTNHHVFAKAAGTSWGVCSVDGKVFRVLDVLATNAAADVALFRVDANDLTPLAVGADPEVGAKVSIISHPDRRFFFRSSGEVARYLKSLARPSMKETTWMSVTADFARGSSGGPVLNADGEVVGMVSSTQSIYYGPPRKEVVVTPAKSPKEAPPAKSDKVVSAPRDQGPLQMVVKNCVPPAALRAITQAPAATAERE
jgi:ribosomal protein L32